MGNLYGVIGLVFLLFFTRFFFNWYDLSLTQFKEHSYEKAIVYKSHYENPRWNSTIAYNETHATATPEVTAVNWWELITKTQYENVPDWFVYMIYLPMFIGLIYLILPIPFKA